MFSQASHSHSVHNRPHGYSITAHPCYGTVGTHPPGMLTCSSCFQFGTEALRYRTTEYLQQLLNCEFRKINKEVFLKSGFKTSLLNTTNSECRMFMPTERIKHQNITKFEEQCARRDFTGMKIISVFSLSNLFELIKRGVKVIHLVRDPRSNWLSQMKLLTQKLEVSMTSLYDFISGSLPYSLTRTTCQDLGMDLSILEDLYFEHLQGNHGKDMYRYLLDNYRIVRYEDIASDPELWTKSMYDFLGIQMGSGIRDWIKKNTQLDDKFHPR